MNILSVRAEVCLVGQVKTGIQNPTSACFLRSSVNFTILQGAYWPYLDTGSGMCEQDGCLCSHLPVYRTLPSPSQAGGAARGRHEEGGIGSKCRSCEWMLTSVGSRCLSPIGSPAWPRVAPAARVSAEEGCVMPSQPRRGMCVFPQIELSVINFPSETLSGY